MFNSILAMGSMFAIPDECPHCEKPFENGELAHRDCLLEKHGGTLPEGFDELAEAFDLYRNPNEPT